MIKEIIENNNNIALGAKDIEILKEHFPACFRNGSFDIERLKEYIKDKVNVTEEGYELRFLGKNYARLLASLDTTTVIVPDEEHNNLPENKDSKNIYISGDNLDALKHLLKSYAGCIKCIYIDPPYNTGSDEFIYTDSFNFTVEELASKLSISEEQASRILDLTRRGSATHSAWLTFMLPRLLLARDLLSKEGVIFISIDDNEQSNLKLLCDDIFGEENLICSFIWKKRQMVDSRTKNGASKDHDYLLCYGRKEDGYILGKESDKTKYSNPDNDSKGPWMSADMTGLATASQRPNLHYDLTDPVTGIVYACPPTGWRYEPKRMSELIDNGEIIFPKDATGRPRRKKFLKDIESEYTGLSSVFDTVYSTQGTRELRELFDGKEYFDFPKPIQYIKEILSQGIASHTNTEVYLLDFFGGSSTTAHAAIELIAEGNNIHYIIVQLQELFKVDSDAYKDGYRTIDELGIDRIKRAAKKVQETNPLFHGDIGFKHFTLQEPTHQSIEKMERFDPHSIFGDKTLVDEFGVQTILTTWLVRDGYGLTPNVQMLNIGGYDVYYTDKHLYVINPNLSNEVVAALLDKYQSDTNFNPQNIVVYGYALSWSELQELKDNLRIIRDGEKNMRINFDIRY
ncbi:MAG: site-specific DNA-methyltransferase [Prevotella sp.]|nr:site-specific DNA-methyltransferase [Prevotella sp.]